MRMLRPRGITFVELLVLIAIIGTLVGLALPQMVPGGGSRGRARMNTCQLNLMQLDKALICGEASHGDFPGYINSIGTPGLGQVRASWVVTTFPYLEQPNLWDKWQAGEYAYEEIELLICPSDPPVELGKPELSYVANAGYIGNVAGTENKANGVFFDRTRTVRGHLGPEDERDQSESPEIVMSMNYIQQHDGAARTIMLTENTNSYYWAYVTQEDQQKVLDRKFHFGICWEQPALLDEAEHESSKYLHRINGSLEYEEFRSFGLMKPKHGFPSSNHPGGVNVAFVDGSVRFISADIDPLVYAQLMTLNTAESDLRNLNGEAFEEEISDEDF